MRELKFRAYDKETKKFYYSDLTCIMTDNMYSFTGGSNAHADFFQEFDTEYRELDIEQYTGMKDKNGKEIYEGDILIWFDLIRPVKVENRYGYTFMFGKDALNKQYATKGEIIGSIHENPDLLKEK